MLTRSRRARSSATLAAAVLTAAVLSGTAPGARAVTGHPAGVIGTSITLATIQSLSGYDVAASTTGTAYIGWISATASSPSRTVHLCTLPVGATACSGGVQTIASLGVSSASGLQVIVSGTDTANLIWFHDTPASINGPQGGAIALAVAPHGLNLGAAHDVVTDAPSFGQLLTAEHAPNGSIWTVTYSGVPTQRVQVRAGLSAPRVSVATPFAVGFAQLAFTGGTPVLAVEKYGAITTSPSYATRSSTGVWSSFRALANTWAVGTNAALEMTPHGLRVVTAVNNASYRPVIAGWTGTGFGPRILTSDANPCAPSSHDGSADPSGRLLDVSWECSRVTVTNYADAVHSALAGFTVSTTPTHTAQIASGTSGIATVVYSVEAATGTNQLLRAVHVRLPDSTVTVARATSAGRVTVTGPRSCLPPVNVPIGWTRKAASGWTLVSGSLRLAGTVRAPGTLDGATLVPGRSYTLQGSAVFARNGVRSTVNAYLAFTTCATS